MIEAVMLWNEPNNKSHWDFQLDPGWKKFAHMTKLAASAVRAEHSTLTRVLGGISPIDPGFIANMAKQGVLDHVDAVGVHGFPLDWNHWQLDQWPQKVAEIQAATTLPVWVSEVGVSTFGADWVQEQALPRTVELLRGKTPRIHWYGLLDLPRAWPATTRHREAEGSSYYRHFYMGVIREDGTPKPAARRLAEVTPDVGVCQWFHFEDPRLDEAIKWMRDMRVEYVRTGLSWSDFARPGREAWFDRQMRALDNFRVTVTFCFTPEDAGIEAHYTSPPKQPEQFAEFCAAMVRRYAC
jgi:beta-xylosidase